MVRFGSINVNGLRNDKKRQNVFNWLKSKKYDVILLQETHCENSDEEHDWAKDWNGTSLWCNGTRLSKGVAILINEKSPIKLLSHNKHHDGRIISVTIQVQDFKIQVVNVYAPNNPQERKTFIKNIHTHVI